MGGDGASDFAEVVECFAYVLCNEVARNAHVYSVDGACYRFAGACECLVVACVGHHHFAGGYVGAARCVDEVLL